MCLCIIVPVAHGIAHRLIAEVIDELDIEGKTVGVSPVDVLTTTIYFNCDMVQAAHGRAPAVATGIKGKSRQLCVYVPRRRKFGGNWYGRNCSCRYKGEKITVVFINNAIYGMTSGQMATTLIGQVTTTILLEGNRSFTGILSRFVNFYLH